MASNKGKAVVTPAKKKGVKTSSTAGIAKRATMNKRSPKEPMAISGDTTGNYAMYKKGGTTKAKKFAALAPPYDKITAADRIAGAKKNKKKK
jgi:hypothetical protein